MYDVLSKARRILRDHPELTSFKLFEEYVRIHHMGRMQLEVAAHKRELTELIEARAVANRMHLKPFN